MPLASRDMYPADISPRNPAPMLGTAEASYNELQPLESLRLSPTSLRVSEPKERKFSQYLQCKFASLLCKTYVQVISLILCLSFENPQLFLRNSMLRCQHLWS